MADNQEVVGVKDDHQKYDGQRKIKISEQILFSFTEHKYKREQYDNSPDNKMNGKLNRPVFINFRHFSVYLHYSIIMYLGDKANGLDL